MNHDYLIAAIAIWAFDRFVRFLRVFAFNGLWRAVVPCSRTSLSLPVKIQKVSSDTLRVELTKTDFPNWSPGSHAFLTEVGGVHWFPQGERDFAVVYAVSSINDQSPLPLPSPNSPGHPFSIASIPTSPSRAMPLKPPQIQVDRSANPQAKSTADQNEYNLSPFRTQENVNQSQDFEMMSRSQSSSISKSGFNSYNGSSNGNSNLTSQLESRQQSEVRGEDSSSSKTLVFSESEVGRNPESTSVRLIRWLRLFSPSSHKSEKWLDEASRQICWFRDINSQVELLSWWAVLWNLEFP